MMKQAFRFPSIAATLCALVSLAGLSGGALGADTTLRTPDNFRLEADVKSTRRTDVQLRWDKIIIPASEGRLQYEIELRRNNGGWTRIYTGSNGQHTVQMQPTDHYFFRARTCHYYPGSNGQDRQTGCSNYGQTLDYYFKPAPFVDYRAQLDRAAMGLTVSSRTVALSETLTLNWNRIEAANEYEFWWSINGEEHTIQLDGTRHQMRHDVVGTYQYSVRGCRPDHCSGWSEVIKVVTAEPVSPTPPTEGDPAEQVRQAAMGLKASQRQVAMGEKVRLTWNTIPGADRYEFKLQLNNKTKPITLHQTYFENRHSVPGEYKYSVRACRETVCSGWSQRIDINTFEIPLSELPPYSEHGAPPPVPRNFQLSAGYFNNDDTITLMFSWYTIRPLSLEQIVYQLEQKPHDQSGGWERVTSEVLVFFSHTIRSNEHYDYRLRACHLANTNTWREFGGASPGDIGSCSAWTSGDDMLSFYYEPGMAKAFRDAMAAIDSVPDVPVAMTQWNPTPKLGYLLDDDDQRLLFIYPFSSEHLTAVEAALEAGQRREIYYRRFQWDAEGYEPWQLADNFYDITASYELIETAGLLDDTAYIQFAYKNCNRIGCSELSSPLTLKRPRVDDERADLPAPVWAIERTDAPAIPALQVPVYWPAEETDSLWLDVSWEGVSPPGGLAVEYELFSAAVRVDPDSGKKLMSRFARVYAGNELSTRIKLQAGDHYAYKIRACVAEYTVCSERSVSEAFGFDAGLKAIAQEAADRAERLEVIRSITIGAPTGKPELDYEFIDEDSIWLILRWDSFNPVHPYLVNYEVDQAAVGEYSRGEFTRVYEEGRTQTRIRVSRGEHVAFRVRACLESSTSCGDYSDTVEFSFNDVLDEKIKHAKTLRADDIPVPSHFKIDPVIIDAEQIELDLNWEGVEPEKDLVIDYQLEAAPVAVNEDGSRQFGDFNNVYEDTLTQKRILIEQGEYFVYRVRSCVLSGFKCSRWSVYRHFNFKQDEDASGVADIETRRRRFDEANPFIFSLYDYVEAQIAQQQVAPPIPPAMEQLPDNRQGYYQDEQGNWDFVYPFSTAESDVEGRAKEVRELARGEQYFRTWSIDDSRYGEWQTEGYQDLDLSNIAFIQWGRTRCNDYGCSDISLPLTLKVQHIETRAIGGGLILNFGGLFDGLEDLDEETLQALLDGEIVPTVPGNFRLNRYSYEDPNSAVVTARWQAATVEHYDDRTITYHLKTARVIDGKPGRFSPVSGCDRIKALSCSATLTTAGVHAFKIQACVLNGNNCSDLNASPTKHFEFKKQFDFSTLTASTHLSRNGKYTINSHLQDLISALAPHEANRAQENLYGLEESINGGPWHKIAGVDRAASKQFNKPAGTYRYRRNINNANMYDQPITVKVEVVPAKMAKPTVSGKDDLSDSTFRINWGNGNNGATRYELRTRQNIYSGNGRYSNWAIWNMKTAHFIDQEHLSQDIQYQVRACIGNSQNYCGVWSDALTVTHLNKPTKAIKPTLRNKTSDMDRSFTVNWIGAEGFKVNRYELSRRHRPIGAPNEEAYYGDWQRLVNENVKTAQQNNLGFNHYQYRVRGCNAAGCGAWSNSLLTTVIQDQPSITPPSKNPPAKPNAPRLSVNDGEMQIDWDIASGATYYEIRERMDGGEWGEPIPGGTHRSIDREAANEGLYEYQVRACNSDGCSEWSQTANKALKVTMDIPDNPLDEVSAYALPGHNPAIGAIDGKHNANSDGSLSYSVDIPVPAGRAGLTPQLSLSYNSESGNGLLGMGWDIGGLSRIHRCGMNVAVDGEHRGIQFDEEDQLCLDGQRMIGNPADYGQSYAEYRLLLQPGTQILALGPEGSLESSDESDSAAFQVKTADGKILTYGEQPTSRLSRHLDSERCSPLVRLAQGCDQWYRQNMTRTYQWMLSRIEDRKGNRIDLVYVNDDDRGDIRLSRVEYNDGLHHIDFQWEDRHDITEAYFAGGLVTMKHRLKQVTTYAGSTPLRRLGLVYQSNQPISRIQRITSCSGTGDDCLLPTEFTWTNGEKGYPAPETLQNANIWSNENSPRVADFDQDGFDDVLSAHGDYWQIAYGGTPGLGHWHNTRYPLTGQWHYSVLMDYNGDGRPDILWPSNGKWRVGITNEEGSGFSTLQTDIPSHGYKHRPRVIDLNGDGRSDLVYLRDDVWRYRLMKAGGGLGNEISTGAHIGEHKDDDHRLNVLVMDFDGDGLQDLLVPKDPYYYAYLSTSKGKFSVIQTSLRLPGYRTSPQVLDINGDGLQDIVIRDSGTGGWDTVSYVLNKGAAFTERRNIVHTDGTPLQVDQKDWNSLTHIVDFDLDGRSDIWHKDKVIHYKDDRVIAERSSRYWTGKLQKENQYALTLDVNGDFMDDMVLFHSTGSHKLYMHAGVRPDYLKAVTNGFGLKTEFVYSGLQGNSDLQGHPDQAFYTDDSEAHYPLVKAGKSAYVIKQVKQDNGKGDNNTASYRYEGLRQHVAGLGSLGFKKQTQIIDATGIKTVTTFSQDYKKYRQGRATRIETYAKNNQLLSRTVNTWENAERGGYYNLSPVNVRLRKNTHLNKDLNGQVLSFEASDYRYDDFNNLKTLTKKVYNGGSENSSVYRTVVTANEWINNEADWILGLVTETKSTVTVAGEDPVVTLTRTQYDESTGYKENESIIDPGDESTALYTTTYSDNDVFGNVEKITVSGPDFETRSTVSKYGQAYGLSIVNKFDELNQKESLQYYPPKSAITGGAYPGKLKEATSVNGIRTRYLYDSYGRLRRTIVGYGSTSPITSYSHIVGCSESNCRSDATYQTIAFTEGQSPLIKEFDKLGRIVREKTYGMNGQLVVVDTDYNALGQVERVSEPYFAGDSALWTRYQYDAIGRPIKTTSADAKVDQVIHNGLTVTYRSDVNGKNQQKVETKTPMGWLKTVVDNDNNTMTYAYTSAGHVRSVAAPGSGNIITEYDVMGHKKRMSDPDKGTWHYRHNALGQLITQTNAKGITSCLAYDKLGRMVKRYDRYQGSVPDAVGDNAQANQQCAGSGTDLTSWAYYTQEGSKKGLLYKITSPHQHETFDYDALARPVKKIVRIDGQDMTIDTQYDRYNRPEIISYPASINGFDRVKAKNRHNALGFVTGVYNADDTVLYSRPEAVDARGNIRESTFGNGVVRYVDVNDRSGMVEGIRSSHVLDLLRITEAQMMRMTRAASHSIQDSEYQFDKLGNLQSRTEHSTGFSETFGYDDLNRLTDVWSNFTGDSQQHSRVSYAANGNIKTKTGVGTYTYGGSCSGVKAGPHALSSINGTKSASYCYDKNGNMTSGDGRTMTYSHFDKPTLITKGNNQVHMRYGVDRQLVYRKDVTGNNEKVTLLVDGIYERITHTRGSLRGQSEEKHYLGSVILTNTKAANGTRSENVEYLHKDHLGSIVAITDQVGQLVQRFSFDAWGKRRKPSVFDMESANDPFNFLTPALNLGTQVTQKGFTGHEQLDNVGIIHMGGRIYDAEIGRFLQADPIIQDATNLQAFNRYSYVSNNPLSYTDPTGYSWNPLKKLGNFLNKAASKINHWRKHHTKTVGRFLNKNPELQIVVVVVTSVMCGPAAAACAEGWGWYLTAAAISATATRQYAAGAPLSQIAKGAIISGITSLITAGIAGNVPVADLTSGQVAGILFTSGVMSEAAGGSFFDGVKGGAIGLAFSAVMQSKFWETNKTPVEAGKITTKEFEVPNNLPNGETAKEYSFNLPERTDNSPPIPAPYSSSGIREEVLITAQRLPDPTLRIVIPPMFVGDVMSLEEWANQQWDSFNGRLETGIKYVAKPLMYLSGGPAGGVAAAYDAVGFLDSFTGTPGTDGQQLGSALSFPAFFIKSAPASAAASVYVDVVVDQWGGQQ